MPRAHLFFLLDLSPSCQLEPTTSYSAPLGLNSSPLPGFYQNGVFFLLVLNTPAYWTERCGVDFPAIFTHHVHLLYLPLDLFRFSVLLMRKIYLWVQYQHDFVMMPISSTFIWIISLFEKGGPVTVLVYGCCVKNTYSLIVHIVRVWIVGYMCTAIYVYCDICVLWYMCTTWDLINVHIHIYLKRHMLSLAMKPHK